MNPLDYKVGDIYLSLMILEADSIILLGARIGRLRVIFKLPNKLYGSWTAPSAWPSEPLAYIEWFTKLKTDPEPHHGMYLVTDAVPLADGNLPGAIVRLSSIR